MARRVFLHIGPPKTGTSFIQHILWTNRSLLAQAGIELPLSNSSSHRIAAWTLCSDTAGWEHPNAQRWNWERVVEQARSIDDTVLISAERLAAAMPADVAHAVETLAPSSIHVIATVRDLGRQLPSLWQQLVKQRRTHTLEEFIRWAMDDRSRVWKWQDVPTILGRWLEHLPPERVHVVTVPAPGAPPAELWTRFASVVGADADAFEIPREMSNASLDAVQVEVLRRFNVGLGKRLPMRAPYYRSVRSWFVPALAECGDHAKRVQIPAAHRQWVVERGSRMMRELQQLGVDVSGDWCDLVPIDSITPTQSVTDDEVLEDSLEMLRRLVEHNTALVDEITELRSQAPGGRPQGARARIGR